MMMVSVATHAKRLRMLAILGLVSLAHLACAAGAPPPAMALDDQIQTLVQAQHQVLASASPDDILNGSERNAASAMALMADIKNAEHHTNQACSLYNQALAHDPQVPTPAGVARDLPHCVQNSQSLPPAQRQWKLEVRHYREQGNVAKAAEVLTKEWEWNADPGTGLSAVSANAAAGHKDQSRAIAAELTRSQGSADTPGKSDPSALMAVASAYSAGGDLNDAIGSLKRAVSVDPNLLPVHQGLGDLFWQLNQHAYNNATLREFTKAQQLAPDDFASNLNLGMILSEYQRFDDAATFLYKSAEANPHSPEPWIQLGSNSYAQGRMAEARDHLQRATALADGSEPDAEMERVYFLLSRIAFAQGNFAEQASLAERAKTLAHAARSRALPSTSAGPTQADPAASLPQPAAQSAEKQVADLAAECLNDAGTALARQQDYADALPRFQQAAQLSPEHPPVLRNLGIAELRLGHPDLALSALSRAVQQDPDDAVAVQYLKQATEAMSGQTPGN